MKCEICGTDYSVEVLNKQGSKFNGMKMCRKHRTEIKNNGYIRDKRKPRLPKDMRSCSVCGSNYDVIYHKEDYICRKHYSQLRLYGKTLERTVFDRNEIVTHEDYAEIILYNSAHEEVARTIIDLDDVEKCKVFKWRYDGRYNYASTGDSDSYYGLHQLIMKTKGKDVVVDHINRNGLDNRKSNLRVTNKSVNAINADLRKNNNSGVTGVSYSKNRELWRSYINFEGKRIELGWFKDKREAVKSRLLSELKYYPDYPPQRHLFEEYNIK